MVSTMRRFNSVAPTMVEVGPAFGPLPTSVMASPGVPQLSKTLSAISCNFLPPGWTVGADFDIATQQRPTTVRPFCLA